MAGSAHSRIAKWLTGTCLQEGVTEGKSMGCAFHLKIMVEYLNMFQKFSFYSVFS